MLAPLNVRSVQGEKRTAHDGCGSPRSPNDAIVAVARPPPADSPTKATVADQDLEAELAVLDRGRVGERCPVVEPDSVLL